MRVRFAAPFVTSLCLVVPPPVAAAPAKAASRSLDVPVALDAAAVKLAPREPGRLVRLLIRAKTGQRVNFALTDIAMSPASASALVVSVRTPADKVLADEIVHCLAAGVANSSGRCDGEFTASAGAGVYVVEIEPAFSTSPSFSVQASTPVGGTLAPGGEAREVVLRRPGQDARLELAVRSGAELSVEAAAVDAVEGFRLKVFRPDGSLVSSAEGGPQRPATVSVSGDAGTYFVEIDPDRAATGTFRLAARANVALTLGGPAFPFAATQPRESRRFAIELRANQPFSLAILDLAHAPEVDSNSTIAVLGADGKRIGGTNCRTQPIGAIVPVPCKAVLNGVASAGRYTVEVSSPPGSLASGKMVVQEVVLGNIAPGGSIAIASLQPTQLARYAFDATQGQALSVELSDIVTDPPGARVAVAVLGPEGFSFTMRIDKAIVRIGKAQAPATGRLAIQVDPAVATLKGATLKLTIEEGAAK